MNTESTIGLPIKYALEPIYVRDGWDSLGYDKGKLDFYIVTKCYVVREITEYSEFDQPKKYYQVIYPFSNDYYYEDIRFIDFNSSKKVDSIIKERKQVPEEYFPGEYRNLKSTDKIFNNLEDALEERDKKNTEIFARSLTFDFTDIYWKEKYEYEKATFNVKVGLLEKFVFEHTKELTIDKPKVKERVRL